MKIDAERTWYNASTGAAVADMSVSCVCGWIDVGVGMPVSIQLVWGTGVDGSFGIQCTNKFNPAATETSVDTLDLTTFTVQPTSPTGTAGSTTIFLEKSPSRFVRVPFTRSSGAGTCAVYASFGYGD